MNAQYKLGPCQIFERAIWAPSFVYTITRVRLFNNSVSVFAFISSLSYPPQTMGSKKEVKGKKTFTFKGQRSRNFSLRKINGLKVQASRIFQKCHRLKNGGLETYDVKYGEKRVQDLNKNVPSTYGYNQRLAYWQGIFQDAQLELNSLKSPEPAGELDVREGGALHHFLTEMISFWMGA